MFQVETDSVRALYKSSLELDCTLKEMDCELMSLQKKIINWRSNSWKNRSQYVNLLKQATH